MRFSSDSAPLSSDRPHIGILLMNVGSPDAPTAKEVRPYLAQFLGDARVVELPGWLWKPVLHGILLNTRPRRSARLYQRIWTEEGSPLIVHSRRQAAALQRHLDEEFDPNQVKFSVEIGMRYGNPSISAGLGKLRSTGATHLLALPMFPQYSQTTTATALDALFDTLKTWRWMPDLRTITTYHTHPAYIEALAQSIEQHWQEHGRARRILFSYHGIPEAYVNHGDPYQRECYTTTSLLAERLNLCDEEYGISFQSRLGPVEWLRPYTDETLAAWGREGVESMEAICPGFSADCLETVDEVEHEGGEAFVEAGGGKFTYIPALNDRPQHILALAEIVRAYIQGWTSTDARQVQLASMETPAPIESTGELFAETKPA